MTFTWLVLLIASVGFLTFFVSYALIFEYQFGARSVQHQIKKLSELKSSSNGVEQDSFLTRAMSFINISENFRRYLMTTGLMLKPEEFILMWALTSLGLPLMAMMLNFGLSTAVIFLFMGMTLMPMLAEMAKKKRFALFNRQLPESLIIISNCLRSGFTFRHSLGRVAQDLPNPIAEELNRVIREVNYGRSMEESLGELAHRMKSAELAMINSAVTIQQRSGGNLAEIIEKVTETINDRITIRNQIRVLTAQGRYSGLLIGALPIFLLLILSFLSPGYINVFFETDIGKMMLLVSAILEAIGFTLIQMIVNIKY